MLARVFSVCLGGRGSRASHQDHLERVPCPFIQQSSDLTVGMVEPMCENTGCPFCLTHPRVWKSCGRLSSA
jgi:hypothetical protein